jgi:putative ABC transport system permease protein
MFNVTRKGLWSHKRRLASTFLAITLGVAFLSGTLVLGDTMRATFADLFETGNAGTDAVVRPATVVDDDDAGQRQLLDVSLVESVRHVDGVADAAPMVEGFGKLVGKDGKTIGGNGPPTFAGNWLGDSPLNSYRLAEGRAPSGDREVVINRGAAKIGDLHVGDSTTILMPDPVTVTIVGLSTFGSVDSAGGLTFAAFDLAGAQELVLHQPGKATSIVVRGSDGVSQASLVGRIQPILPTGTTAITEQQLTADQKESINRDFLDLFTSFLLVFAGIALLVATFSIFNTFSIIVAQRSKESALLRAIGASRRQVLASTIAEAAIVGVAAAVAGLFSGLAVAALLKALFVGLGIDIPASGLVFSSGTVVTSLVVGIGVTLLAGIVPAVKASRIPPIAALRDVAMERTGASLPRILAGGTLSVGGVAIVLRAVLGHGDNVLGIAALGSLVLMVGVVALGPVVAGGASRILGWPIAHARGVTGALARENAIRNPRRTSGTAAALMIGVGVVTLFTVFATSATASVTESVEKSFAGDLVVTAGGFGGESGFSPNLATSIAALPEVATSVGLGDGAAKLDGAVHSLTIGDPAALARVLDLGVVDGSLASMGEHDLAIDQRFATEQGWHVGTVVPITFADGTAQDFRVAAVYSVGDLIGNVIMGRTAWAPHATQAMDVAVLAKLADGVAMADGRRAVEAVAAAYPGIDVQDKDQYVQSVAAGVNQSLALIYVMLVLAIVIALMGIANTLSLSIHERTRELGLLRAVGQTRRQVRAMVRWESVIMAVFGTLGGVGIGVFLGWALVKAAGGEGIGTFSVAPTQLVTVCLLGAIAGVLSSVRPARRAARLDVLTAIAAA